MCCTTSSFALPCCKGFMHQLQDWKSKGSRLAASSFSSNHDVTTSKDERHALRLYRCWQPVHHLLLTHFLHLHKA